MHLQSLHQAKRRASNVRMEDGQIRLGPAFWSHKIYDVKVCRLKFQQQYDVEQHP